MKQVDIAQQLGSLIGNSSPTYTPVAPDDVIPTELENTNVDPVFDVSHEDVQTKTRLEALEVVKYIFNSVVPEDYKNESMLQNKTKVDAYQLGMLYYHQKMNNIVLEAAMNRIAHGDENPRIFEVIEKYIKRAQELTEQITNMHNDFRKYYIDSYLDLESKRKMDESNPAMLSSAESVQAIPIIQENSNGTIRPTGPKDLIQKLNAEKIKKAQNKDIE